jgi:hypothetical protein
MLISLVLQRPPRVLTVLVMQIVMGSFPWRAQPSSSLLPGLDQQVDMALPVVTPGGDAWPLVLLLAFQRCLGGLAVAGIGGLVDQVPVLQHC